LILPPVESRRLWEEIMLIQRFAAALGAGGVMALALLEPPMRPK
jgi:hypothetical protein